MNLCPVSVSLLFSCFLITSRIVSPGSTHFTGDVSINCGSNAASAVRNGRQWIGDEQQKLSPSLQINGKSKTSTVNHKLASDDPVPHRTARISRSPFSLLKNFSASLTADGLAVGTFAKEFLELEISDFKLLVGFRYLVRLHFSEVGLKIAGTGDLMFKLLINEMIAQTESDILRARDGNYFVLHRDYIVMMPGHKTDSKRDILISILSHDELRDRHGVLAGFEIVKLSNHDNSLASPNPLPRPQYSTSTITRCLSAILGHKNATSALAITIISLINIVVYMLRDIWDASSTNDENRPSERAVRLFHHFSLREIQIATENFYEGHVIGRGGFGKVYKCLIRGNVVAVKRLRSGSDQGEREFLTEIETLSELRHINLVSLIGYCKEGREMILVYEYMPKGTLADHLYKLARRNRNCTSLTWKQRLNICIEAGRGLDYLHTGHRVIHRDVKASNILLDEKFVAKVSDFGLAKAEDRSRLQSHVSTRVRGTFGYFDPYYMNTQRLTRKSDTYAFGVVLFEVLCGRPAINSRVSEEERVLITWVRGKINNGEVEDIVDSSLRQEILPDSLKTFVKVAEKCLHDEPRNRPTMSQVVLQLESALEQQGERILTLPTHITPVASDQNPSNEDIIIFSESARQSRRAATTDTQSVILSPAIQSNLSYSPTNNREFGKPKKCSSLCFLLCCPCCWLRSKWRKAPSPAALELSIPIMVHEEPHESPNLPATRTAHTKFMELDRSSYMRRYFSLQEIRKATDSFNTKHLIGQGGFGQVFKGVIDDGATTVAIKRRDPSSRQGANEFRTEILILSKLMHRNLVSLIGYCNDKEEMILVYEYMELGNLCDHLYNPDFSLTWKQRLHICLGAASGLHYLHTGARQVVIHRDVKTTQILLDKKLVPKMSDFGVSKVLHSDWDWDKTHVTTSAVGTLGYMDPEYCMTMRLSVKSDVYSFGVVLFEVLYKFVEIAVACVSEKGIDRPAMGDVIRNLELAMLHQEATAIDEEPPGPWMMTKMKSHGYL